MFEETREKQFYIYSDSLKGCYHYAWIFEICFGSLYRRCWLYTQQTTEGCKTQWRPSITWTWNQTTISFIPMHQGFSLVPFTRKMNNNNFRQLIQIFGKATRVLLDTSILSQHKRKTSAATQPVEKHVRTRMRACAHRRKRTYVSVIETSLLEIAPTTRNPSTASQTLLQAGLWYQGSSFIRDLSLPKIHSINFQSRQHNPSHQIFGRQVENCSASWRRQNPFLLAIFCNENSRNECAITCGNKFQILSHKSSVLKISNCKLTLAYLNFKMLISLCVWIATEERENISGHLKKKKSQKKR